VDVGVNSRVVIPAGSVMRGVVTQVEPATRTNRTARMTVSFDQVTVNGQAYAIRGTVSEAIEGSGIKGETARIGTGAGVGAVIGGLLGGFKGALAGILIGGGGTIAATEGKEVQIPQGSVLRVRLDSPAYIAPPARGWGGSEDPPLRSRELKARLYDPGRTQLRRRFSDVFHGRASGRDRLLHM
jgi:hypothetical protein